MYGRPEKCNHCGKEFEGRWPRVDKKYCSNKCRQAAFRKRKWDAMIAARKELHARAEAARKAAAKKKRVRKKRNARA